ncbi:MAG: molybdopterin synthase catalytic subunit MoaE [Rhodocyclaceae bacterium]|nr:molybdopterin synthase catalytic subunit MoaE [Rhodocyclaceae bacterium]
MIEIRVQEADFDMSAEMLALSRDDFAAGALASFVGLVRSEGEVLAMTLEHYPGMTEKALAEIAEEAKRRWPIRRVCIVHRIGRLLPGERIVFVGVTAGHRHDAFAACEFLMDYLKTRAPFWKKEYTRAGERWVEARLSDDEAASRWRLDG